MPTTSRVVLRAAWIARLPTRSRRRAAGRRGPARASGRRGRAWPPGPPRGRRSRPPRRRRSRPSTAPGPAGRSRCRRRSGARWRRRRAACCAAPVPAEADLLRGRFRLASDDLSAEAGAHQRQPLGEGGARDSPGASGPSSSGRERRVQVVLDVEFAGDVRAGQPTSSGAHTSRRIAWGDRTMTTGASSGPALLPSQASSRTGKRSTPRIGASAVVSCSATVFSAICASCVTRGSSAPTTRSARALSIARPSRRRFSSSTRATEVIRCTANVLFSPGARHSPAGSRP